MVLWVTLHKNRRVMKHMLFLIILAMLNGISCMASDAAPVAECDTSTIILSGGSGMGGGNRSPQAVPFGASLSLFVYSCDNPFKKKTSISEIISPDTSEYNYYICAL